ncbi:hypothetical protein SAMN05216548_101220 [Faunimonas pinastri]|uniref:DUF721 domain-containing protein n=1 Tax=Faunimonas pinastri TaxID=1855383 RepID=A0A1H8ZSZ6_9HYPH|nr:DciA family protein [Faunimonas pinastri]SEP66868.1 hypothetical protein SAMN05216548_101220 [Faunimonas pinastri]
MASPRAPQSKSLAQLIGGTLDPVIRKRGLARVELLSWWPDIVGPAYAAHTIPDRIRWPRDGKAATLTLKCDPSLALQLSYEKDRIRERLNTFLGYPAVGVVKILQQRVGRSEPPPPRPRVRPEDEARLVRAVSAVDGPLKDSLLELGRAVLAR